MTHDDMVCMYVVSTVSRAVKGDRLTRASWVRIPHRAVIGHNNVRLLVVCPGYKKQNELHSKMLIVVGLK